MIRAVASWRGSPETPSRRKSTDIAVQREARSLASLRPDDRHELPFAVQPGDPSTIAPAGVHPPQSDGLNAESGYRDYSTMRAELLLIRQAMLASEASNRERIAAVPPVQQASARNLLHYLALRHHDLRSLQAGLSSIGLSSLGRAEAHALASIEAVLALLDRIDPPASGSAAPLVNAERFEEGSRLLREHTDELLPGNASRRDVRVMVTLSTEAASDYGLVHDLIVAGMDCARINCAHDGPVAWAAMIAHVRRAETECYRRCRVLMDLPGPKLRTGPLRLGPRVIKIKPVRDELGNVLAPARVWLAPASDRDSNPAEAAACLRLPAEWLAKLSTNDSLRFIDARGSKRMLVVVEVADAGIWAKCRRTAYLVPGTELTNKHAGRARVGDLPARPASIVLRPGDTLVLTRSQEPGRPADKDVPARIGCTLPEVFGAARIGDRVWLDDGKIGGRIETVGPDEMCLRIDGARSTGERLRAEKGINLPDTDVPVPALSDQDRQNLAFVAKHADAVGLSFVRNAEDVNELFRLLTALGRVDLDLVLKIETRRGFENLPELLLAAMHFGRAGVMIARGDLAVECGYERLAEVQEEILWIAEAAHMPVIWATQVLETLTRSGVPTRAEVTDAAMGVRAECVMLNKGPHVVEAVRALDGILTRMQSHQHKKQSLMRRLQAWTD